MFALSNLTVLLIEPPLGSGSSSWQLLLIYVVLLYTSVLALVTLSIVSEFLCEFKSAELLLMNSKLKLLLWLISDSLHGLIEYEQVSSSRISSALGTALGLRILELIYRILFSVYMAFIQSCNVQDVGFRQEILKQLFQPVFPPLVSLL